MTRQSLGPEPAPIVRRDLIQRIYHIVESVGLNHWRSTGRAVEQFAKIIDRLFPAGTLANDGVYP